MFYMKEHKQFLMLEILFVIKFSSNIYYSFVLINFFKGINTFCVFKRYKKTPIHFKNESNMLKLKD